MLAALAMMGWAQPMPMGGWIPLQWAEIHAFAALTGRLVTSWECEMARSMSQAYIAGLSEGQELLSIPPMERS